MNRSKKAALNLLSQLILQLVTAICGFIVPKLILESFGSELNGLTTSIAQFLGIISLMESGFGAVAKSAFYKSLAKRDTVGISGVYNATESFFKKVALVFLTYCILLSFVFPCFQKAEFGYFFVLTLVLIIGISSFVQYYFGMSYTVLLNADQNGYISAFLQVISVVLNAAFTLLLLKARASIHIVKLVSAIVLFIRPIAINLYCRRKYAIDRSVPQDLASVSQKWDNFGQSIALYVHTKTSYLLITFFLDFVKVSIYSVYSLITTSLSAVITSISTGFVAGLGNIYANHEEENFKRVFSLYEFINHFTTFVFYTIALITMLPFVKVYTSGIADKNLYILPLFGTLLVVGELIYCIRLPYYYVITNAGHFKQITKSAYIEAGLNIVVSLSLIFSFGLTGLAIGAGIAMTYRTTFLIWYCSKNITKTSLFVPIKRLVLFSAATVATIAVGTLVTYEPNGFLQWFLYAAVVGVTVFAAFAIISLVFCREDVKTLFQKLRNAVK